MSEILGVVASAYGVDSVRLIEQVRPNVMRVAAGDREIAVKVFAADETSRAVLESQLLAHVAGGHGYRVQTIVPTASGESLAHVDGGTLLVTCWEPGGFKPYTQIVEEEWRALGSELASLHERLDSFVGELSRLSDAIRTRDLEVERATLVGYRERVPEDVRAHIDTMIALLDARGSLAEALPPGVAELPIHNDYNQYNYVFDGILPPIILDWEGAIAAPREYEVVRCMNHLPIVAPACATAFVGGYRSVRGLDAAALRWAIDASLVDHAVKRWPIERLLAGDSGAERVMRGSMEVLRALSARANELEDFYLR